MDVLTSYREFQRNQDGIVIPLRLDEWPADVPLPPGSTIVGVGPNAMIWRVRKHPWSPPGNGKGSGAKRRAAARTKRRGVQRKTRSRVIA